MKTFKTLLFALSIAFTMIFTSCQKEEVKPNSTPNQSCNCGTITNDDIVFDDAGNMYYSLTIANECSGNLETYYFSQEVWMNALVGEYFCITNVSSWISEGTFKVSKKVDVTDKQIQ
jgi:hypothetical protein